MKSKTNFYLKLFGLPFFVLVVIILTTLFLLIPKVNQFIEIKRKISSQEKDISTLSMKIADLSSLSEADLVDNSNLLLEALPAGNEFFVFLGAVKKVAQESGLTIEDFDLTPGVVSTGSAEAGKKFDVYTNPIKITFSGSYEDIRKFMDRLEKSLPTVIADELKITASLISTSSADISSGGKMQVSYYFLPVSKQLSDYYAPLPKISSEEQKEIEGLKTFDRYVPVGEEEGTVVVGRENLF